MKSQNFLRLTVLGIAFVISLAGCAKRPSGITPLPPRSTIGFQDTDTPAEMQPQFPPGDTLNGDNAIGSPLPPIENREGMIEDREVFAEETVYFDFDRATVKASEAPKIEAVAAYLMNEPNTMVEIEGHCDERGTEEYNLALGDRRALSIREYLLSLGIQSDRVHTTSYGEMLPADPGHDEQAWAKNRRGEFVLLRPPQ